VTSVIASIPARHNFGLHQNLIGPSGRHASQGFLLKEQDSRMDAAHRCRQAPVDALFVVLYTHPYGYDCVGQQIHFIRHTCIIVRSRAYPAEPLGTVRAVDMHSGTGGPEMFVTPKPKTRQGQEVVAAHGSVWYPSRISATEH